MENREISLTRDCDAIQIPSGHPIVLPAGMGVVITQSLGGTYTVATPGGLADKINGFDTLAPLVEEFTPEAVEAWTGVPAETTRRIARDFAATPRAAVYGRIGLCNQEFGTLASWLVDVVNLITGHFDVEGGLMWGKPAAAPLAWMNNTDVTGEPEPRRQPVDTGTETDTLDAAGDLETTTDGCRFSPARTRLWAEPVHGAR